MNQAYLLTGGNIGNRLYYLQQAAIAVEKYAGTIIKKSSIYETAAWGLTDQENFLNQALFINTLLPPHDLLETILIIEQEMGRTREIKFGPRVIDLDILFYNSIIIDKPNLTIPHSQIASRRFVLKPLYEIAPNLTHPILKKNIGTILAECTDTLKVNIYKGN